MGAVTALTEWVRQIVVLVFVVSAAQLLLPTDDMRPYVRFVLGLVIVSALLASVMDLGEFATDFQELFIAPVPSRSSQDMVERGQSLTRAALDKLTEEGWAETGGGAGARPEALPRDADEVGPAPDHGRGHGR